MPHPNRQFAGVLNFEDPCGHSDFKEILQRYFQYLHIKQLQLPTSEIWNSTKIVCLCVVHIAQWAKSGVFVQWVYYQIFSQISQKYFYVNKNI